MAGGNHHAPYEFPAPHLEGDVGSGIWAIQHQDPEAVRGQDLGGGARKLSGLKADIESNEHRRLRPFDGFEVIGCGLRRPPHVRESEGIGDDGAPAVGSEFDWTAHNDEKSVRTVLSPSTTPGRSFADRPT